MAITDNLEESRIVELEARRIHSRIDTQSGDVTAQFCGAVEVGERGERGWVGVVVGRYVHGLQRSDRLAPSRSDALLKFAHLVSQGGLVTHR